MMSLNSIGGFLHRLGVHRWHHVFGTFNRYYECRICGKRSVSLGLGGCHPIAQWWLDGLADAPPLLPPRGGSGLSASP